MPKINGAGLGEYLRDQRVAAQTSLRQLAKITAVSNPYLNQLERGLRRPSIEILQQLAKGLRISAEALYVQAGMLEQRTGDTAVVEAILSDVELAERQKRVLLDIYESFRRENAVRAAQDPATERVGEPGEEPIEVAAADDTPAGGDVPDAAAGPTLSS